MAAVAATATTTISKFTKTFGFEVEICLCVYVCGGFPDLNFSFERSKRVQKSKCREVGGGQKKGTPVVRGI